jgi:hypothetical protein
MLCRLSFMRGLQGIYRVRLGGRGWFRWLCGFRWFAGQAGGLIYSRLPVKPCRSNVMSARLPDIHGLFHLNWRRQRSRWWRDLWQGGLKALTVRLLPVDLRSAISAEKAAWHERRAAQIAGIEECQVTEAAITLPQEGYVTAPRTEETLLHKYELI